MAVVTRSDLAREAPKANLLDEVLKGFSPTVLAAAAPSGKVVDFFPQTPLTVSHRCSPKVRDMFKFYLVCETAMGNEGMARNFLNSPKASLESIKAWFSKRKVQTKLSRINSLSITGTLKWTPLSRLIFQ